MWLQALQWVADNAQYPAVVTASVSGDYSATLDQAVQTLTEIYGIPVMVSAGRSVRPETTEPALCTAAALGTCLLVQDRQQILPGLALDLAHVPNLLCAEMVKLFSNCHLYAD